MVPIRLSELEYSTQDEPTIQFFPNAWIVLLNPNVLHFPINIHTLYYILYLVNQ